MKAIVELQLKEVTSHLKNAKDISVSFDDNVKKLLADEGYDPSFGARPLKRLIQTKLLDPLAMKIIDGTITEGSSVKATVRNSRLQFS